MAETVERRFHARYGTRTYALQVYKAGVLGDVDANEMQVRLETDENTPTVIFDRLATHPSTGIYETSISSAEAQTPGLYRLVFTYEIDGTPHIAVEYIEIDTVGPAYIALRPELQDLIEGVWWKFADLFDSPLGGPHLQVYFQTHMNRNRAAQLLDSALNNINAYGQPNTTYSFDNFPLDVWGGLLSKALTIEIIKHLVRSYTEQPETQNVSEARLDRRDYMDRWLRVLEMETPGFERQVEQYRIAHMGLGDFRVLVAGGAYGNFGQHRTPAGVGHAAARGYYMPRWH